MTGRKRSQFTGKMVARCGGGVGCSPRRRVARVRRGAWRQEDASGDGRRRPLFREGVAAGRRPSVAMLYANLATAAAMHFHRPAGRKRTTNADKSRPTTGSSVGRCSLELRACFAELRVGVVVCEKDLSHRPLRRGMGLPKNPPSGLEAAVEDPQAADKRLRRTENGLR